MPFLCECADETCLGRIALTATDYYALHIDRSQYVVLDGHLTIRGETMVQKADGYKLVTKADLGLAPTRPRVSRMRWSSRTNRSLRSPRTSRRSS